MMKRSSRKFSPWKVRDKVWLEATNLQIPYPFRKLVPKCHGPFEIAQVLPALVYKFPLPFIWKIHDVFHDLSIVKLKHMDLPSSNLQLTWLVLKKSTKWITLFLTKALPGQKLYLTTWKGYPSSEDTWELESNLYHSPTLLQEYKRTCGAT